MDESILFFSRVFLSKLSLKDLYILWIKGYLYWNENGMRRVSFFKIELADNLVSQLDWVASSSCELIERASLDFCPVVLQLAWRFSFSTCFTHVYHLAACQSWATREIQSWVPASMHSLEHFFTLSHSLLLHDSHLNTGFLNME